MILCGLCAAEFWWPSAVFEVCPLSDGPPVYISYGFFINFPRELRRSVVSRRYRKHPSHYGNGVTHANKLFYQDWNVVCTCHSQQTAPSAQASKFGAPESPSVRQEPCNTLRTLRGQRRRRDIVCWPTFEPGQMCRCPNCRLWERARNFKLTTDSGLATHWYSCGYVPLSPKVTCSRGTRSRESPSSS